MFANETSIQQAERQWVKTTKVHPKEGAQTTEATFDAVS